MAEKDEKEELKIVTDNPKDLEETAEDLPPKKEADEEGDGKKKKDAAAEESGEEEEKLEEARLGHDEEEEEEHPRDRKSERRSRKERQRIARERQQREIGFLRKELDRVDRDNVEMRRRLAGQETRSYDTKVAELDRNIRDAEQIMQEALDEKNGKDHTEAVRIRDQLVEAKRKVLEEKEEHDEAVKEEHPQRRQAPQVDPEVVRRGQAWLGRNTWFKTDQRGRPLGQDSRIARAIDESVLEDGFDPRTDEYWEEFEKRVGKQLPHLKKKAARDDEDDELEEETPRRKKVEADDEEETPERKNGASRGPKFRVGGRDRPLKSNEVYLPKDRIEALKEAGIWDDPEERARYLKAYQTYDKQKAAEA